MNLEPPKLPDALGSIGSGAEAHHTQQPKAHFMAGLALCNNDLLETVYNLGSAKSI